jgi:2-C-methyl-D-erythritol 2,4-cyclodiphosphate synthase
MKSSPVSRASGLQSEGGSVRVGLGYDIHALKPGRRLVIGGAEIASPLGAEAHSDGDVLIHSVIDALLGAARLGDIGTHFPDTDPQYRGICSRVLLRKTADLLRSGGWTIVNIDSNVILQEPRLRPHIELIVANIAADLGLAAGSVSVKAKTKESLDATGEGRAVEAQAAVLIAPVRTAP